MDLGIAGKVALISGGSRGIGRATAELLARDGVQVIVVATGKDALNETVASIRANGGQAIGVTADLTVRGDVERAVAAGTREFGPPDIVIFNGVTPRSSTLHRPSGAARYEKGVHVNFFDVTDEQIANSGNRAGIVSSITRIVVPNMIERRWGRLINIGSGAAKEPPDLPHLLTSVGSAAVVTLQKSLANELGPFGITVNYLGIGFVGTQNMWDYIDMLALKHGTTREAALEPWTSTIPLRRVGAPEEAAAVVTFLCSQGAGYVTGQFITVDGGLHRAAF